MFGVYTYDKNRTEETFYTTIQDKASDKISESVKNKDIKKIVLVNESSGRVLYTYRRD